MQKTINHYHDMYSPDMNGGDKKRARIKIRALVLSGALPNPNSVPCTICKNKKKSKRNVYHHYKSYAAEHYKDVVVLCTSCHLSLHKNQKIGICETSPETNVWISEESAVLVDRYRATRMPVPSKQEATRDLIEIGWETVEKKLKAKKA